MRRDLRDGEGEARTRGRAARRPAIERRHARRRLRSRASEYLREHETCARASIADGRVQWVEVCYCPTPLAEEREYWEEYFDLEKVQDAHARSRCRDLNGDRAVGLRRLRLHRPPRSRASPTQGPSVPRQP